jgi:hypothetical protein
MILAVKVILTEMVITALAMMIIRMTNRNYDNGS